MNTEWTNLSMYVHTSFPLSLFLSLFFLTSSLNPFFYRFESNSFFHIDNIDSKRFDHKVLTPSDTIHESLERINASLEKLIEEGKESLVEHPPHPIIPQSNRSLCLSSSSPVNMKRLLLSSKAHQHHHTPRYTKKACLPLVLHVVSLCILQLLSPRSSRRLRFLFSLIALCPLHRKHTHHIIGSIDQFLIRFF